MNEYAKHYRYSPGLFSLHLGFYYNGNALHLNVLRVHTSLSYWLCLKLIIYPPWALLLLITKTDNVAFQTAIATSFIHTKTVVSD